MNVYYYLKLKNIKEYSMCIRNGLAFLCLLIPYLTITTCNNQTGIDADDSPNTVTDIEGNVYQAVKIGDQVWTVENLRVTTYNDGTPLPLDTSSTGWVTATTPKYCSYNNMTNNDSIKKYGLLYNWHVVDPANPKQVAPAGWHVPSDSEWYELEYYLFENGYNQDSINTTYIINIAKSLAAKSDWSSCQNAGAIGNDLTKNNGTGFSALPSGIRLDGTFTSQGFETQFWCSTTLETYAAASCKLYSCDAFLSRGFSFKSCGYSVRLVKN